MPEFKVEIDVAFGPELDEAQRAAIIAAERVRGRELVAAGAIVRIWRIPGGIRNVGIWSARDATELHALLMSLPAAPWATIEVTALAVHPLEEDSHA